MEMLRESEPPSLFIQVIQRVLCYQKGTINIIFSQSSLHSNSGFTCRGTPACTGNAANNLDKAPKRQTRAARGKSGRDIGQFLFCVFIWRGQ